MRFKRSHNAPHNGWAIMAATAVIAMATPISDSPKPLRRSIGTMNATATADMAQYTACKREKGRLNFFMATFLSRRSACVL